MGLLLTVGEEVISHGQGAGFQAGGRDGHDGHDGDDQGYGLGDQGVGEGGVGVGKYRLGLEAGLLEFKPLAMAMTIATPAMEIQIAAAIFRPRPSSC